MNRINLRLMEEWRENQPTKNLKLNNVIVEHKTHLKALEKGLEYNFNRIAKYCDGREIPIIVKPSKEKKGEYILLFGLGQFDKFKKLGRSGVEAVVTSNSRTGLMKAIRRDYKGYWSMEDVKIKKSFKDSYPSPEKMINKAKLMMEGEIEPVTISCKSGYLIDGYITYLLLKFRGENKIRVIIR